MWSLLFSLAEMELTLLVFLVACLQLRIIVATEQGVRHASATVNFIQYICSSEFGLEIVACLDLVRYWITSDELLSLNIRTLFG